MTCEACIAQGGGLCPGCWRRREAERERRGEEISRHDTALWNAYVQNAIGKAELLEGIRGDKRQMLQLIGALKRGGK